MSEKKKNSNKKTASPRSADKKGRAERNKGNTVAERKQPEDTFFHQILPFLMAAFALFLTLSFVITDKTGIVGEALHDVFFGLFGAASYLIPLLLFILAFAWRKKLKSGELIKFILCQAVFFVCLSTLLHFWTGGIGEPYKSCWKNGVNGVGGGVIGGSIGWAMNKLVRSVGAHIICFTVIIISGLYMFDLTPHSIYIRIAYFIHESKEKSAERKSRKQYRGKPEPEPYDDEREYARVKRDPVDRHRFSPDVDMDGSDEEDEDDGFGEKHVVIEDVDAGYEQDGEEDDGVPPFDIPGNEGIRAARPVLKKRVSGLDCDTDDAKSGNGGINVGTADTGEEKIDLSSIFTDSDGVDVLQKFADEQKRKALEKSADIAGSEAELEITREGFVTDAVPITEEVRKEYEFPPVSILKLDTSPKNVDISDELHTNATKLVETLRSFKVKTRIVNVSRGPTITRYELAPEEGVRVRAISNLVDDIALNLATSGVRIEAPIPGKAAVGVEVPNKTVSTVYLRDLVDTETFRKATSRLNVGLGVDVAGDPVYLDIAKMPHLLIAGATGMGKSVCINSLIISLLYKATSEEVKLILIDPKKVEFSLYSGLPHLLVPVVSDPKKAAGSLQWAVTEMERRFELIEEVGVRDLKGYNAITKDDPDKEFLPQIVIVIDELADLMMTASADVETSICRLAQKARAAGMHLVIGTQRPSVDVITGLIKANIPSRIAFTVSSGTDSKVILDMGGAEKLIGRGDMLYAPVGASKPIRVQGAFVSDSEVESIVEYIKEHNGGETNYSKDIIDSIDRAAAACGNKKGSGFGGDGDMSPEGGDPMLRQAIELAVESGKISTSLIQRRLSLGYGRAAKLIDEMQIRGIVSPPEGQKPRTVLITKEQYMEMILDRSEDL